MVLYGQLLVCRGVACNLSFIKMFMKNNIIILLLIINSLFNLVYSLENKFNYAYRIYGSGGANFYFDNLILSKYEDSLYFTGEGNWFNYFIGKIDNIGKIQWQLQIKGTGITRIYDLIELNDQYLLVIGQIYEKIIFYKIDKSKGEIIDTILIKNLENNGRDNLHNGYQDLKIISFNDSSFILLVNYRGQFPKLIIIDSQGNPLKTYFIDKKIRFNNILFYNDYLYLFGITGENLVTGLNLNTLNISKIDTNFNLIWSKNLNFNKQINDFFITNNNDSLIFLIDLNQYNSKIDLNFDNRLLKIDIISGNNIWLKKITPNQKLIFNGINSDKNNIILYGRYGDQTFRDPYSGNLQNYNPIIIQSDFNGKITKSLYSPLYYYDNKNTLLDLMYFEKFHILSVKYKKNCDCKENANLIFFNFNDQDLIESNYFVQTNNIKSEIINILNYNSEEFSIKDWEFEVFQNNSIIYEDIQIINSNNYQYFKINNDDIVEDEFLLNNKKYINNYFTSKVNNLRIRALPNLNGEIISKLNKNEKVINIEFGNYDIIDDKFGYWTKCKFDESIVGWIFGAYLEP